MLSFPDEYFKNEIRLGFHVTAMMKRMWGAQMEILSWIDETCKKHDINWIMCYGSLLGTVRHRGFIPWDDDIDIAMLRADYERFMDAVAAELPPYLKTKSLLPGAIAPKEMCFNICNGSRIDTTPEFLGRFHGCPYSTGVDIFVFDRVPADPEEFAYQDRLIRLLDRLLMLQWAVNDKSIGEAEYSEYCNIKAAMENELSYTFNNAEPLELQILRLLDLACGLCEDCGSDDVENREQVIYYGKVGFKDRYFTDRIWMPFEGVMDVPISRDYDALLTKIFGDYRMPRKHTSQHEYPIYKYQRIRLYEEHIKRGWDIPEIYLEYDENGKLIVDPEDVKRKMDAGLD